MSETVGSLAKTVVRDGELANYDPKCFVAQGQLESKVMTRSQCKDWDGHGVRVIYNFLSGP